MSPLVRRLATVATLAVVCGGCHAKQEYSCAVSLKTSSASITLAQDSTLEWYEAALGSVFGAFEKTTKGAQAQCIEMVRGRLRASLTQQYPDGVVACACVEVDGF